MLVMGRYSEAGDGLMQLGGKADDFT